MGWFVAIIIILVALGIWSLKVKSDEKQRDLQQGIYAKTLFSHLGGHPYLKQDDNVIIAVKKDRIEIYRYPSEIKLTNPILISQIKNIQFKSEEEIQKDVTLTRLLTLGVFAFALPKKTSVNNQYLIIQYEENGVEINCIFKSLADTLIGKNYDSAGDLLSIINRVKLENSI